MALKDVFNDSFKLTRNSGNPEKSKIFNLLKDIAEATEGKVGFSPDTTEKVQSAHNTLSLYKAKKATEKQLMDTFASLGLTFYQWIMSTHNNLLIDSVEGVKEIYIEPDTIVDSKISTDSSIPTPVDIAEYLPTPSPTATVFNIKRK